MSIASNRFILEGDLLERAQSLAEYVIAKLSPIEKLLLSDVTINGVRLDYTTNELIRMIRELEPYGLLVLETRLHTMATLQEDNRWMGDGDGRLFRALHAINRDAFPDGHNLH